MSESKELEKAIKKKVESLCVNLNSCDKDDFKLRHVYLNLNLSEQTFFSWKKKNPEVFQALVNGYKFQQVLEIVEDICVLNKAFQIINNNGESNA